MNKDLSIEENVKLIDTFIRTQFDEQNNNSIEKYYGLITLVEISTRYLEMMDEFVEQEVNDKELIEDIKTEAETLIKEYIDNNVVMILNEKGDKND